MSDHAFLAPSSAHRVISCPASLRQEPKYPDTPKVYTAEGTLAHDLAAMALADGIDLNEKVGKRFEVDGFEFVVSQEMVDYVLGYCDFVREISEGADALLIEQRVRYGPLVFRHDDHLMTTVVTPDGVEVTAEIAAEEIGYGRADAIAVFPRKLVVCDLKYGYTRVWAEDNEQGMLYGLGALHEYSWMGDFDEVEIIIYQPRVDTEKPASRWTVSVADLMAFAGRFREAALTALNDPEPPYNPGEKQCQFCKVGPFCEARKGVVLEWVGGGPALATEFDDITEVTTAVLFNDIDAEWLGLAMSKVPLIEDWCKAVRGEVDRRMLSGGDVPGFKLVEGRQGNRAWTDPEAVETLLKKTWRMKVDEVYNFSLKSPTATEKVLKANKARWAKLQPYIVRSPGKPSVAPIEDKRAALTLTASPEDFA